MHSHLSQWTAQWTAQRRVAEGIGFGHTRPMAHAQASACLLVLVELTLAFNIPHTEVAWFHMRAGSTDVPLLYCHTVRVCQQTTIWLAI